MGVFFCISKFKLREDYNFMQAVIKSVKAPRVPVSLIEDYGPQLEASFRSGQVLQGVPSGVDVRVDFGEYKLLSYVYDFGSIRGLMPVHEVGVPVFPSYLGGGHFSSDDLESFLSKSNDSRRRLERIMVRILSANVPLSFMILSLDGGVAVLSRRCALEKLSEGIDLVVGQEVPVTVMLALSKGAFCDYEGLNVYIPRHEVYYGDTSPRELLREGETYLAKITYVGTPEERSRMIYASTRALHDDPWEKFNCGKGSIRRAVIKEPIQGRNLFRVQYMPGVTGIAQGAPLSQYHIDQVVSVRIMYINPKRRFIKGRIED